ncbi:hypothetical protein BABINDRAFT_168328 [Babjeviella inositovora NRRL Y-12698]|uniref:Tetrapyrrole biosynthesis uroporphyrinogen III synthase domain-containing protein n=1 Tax=Babjeviella inositovora NRRL Y-12698 TaxID=984486 RepID=A0A1E3QLW2_9ASCO|nr:uncharacterized protein BABINDRAFT_168328 [Babjeviella inositovora NRRL Y-12698]ODQ78608.1 hypothetical protein BABINDRAFT_168328 [Babjeviella inositovora NRRL Y-12698]
MPSNVLLLKNKTTPSDPYEAQFLEAGYTPHFIPLLEHIHLEKRLIVEFLLSDVFALAASFIITSQRAVECLNECMDLIPNTAAKTTILDKPAFTVGPATSSILKAAGFSRVLGGIDAGNGSVLSDIIIDHEIYRGGAGKIVFFTGEIRKDIIPRKLAASGFNVLERVIYKTIPRADIVRNFQAAYSEHITEGETTHWIIFFSPQGTEYIVEYLTNIALPTNVRLASIGPTTEDYLVEKGLPPHIVAPKPHASALVKSLDSYRTQ